MSSMLGETSFGLETDFDIERDPFADFEFEAQSPRPEAFFGLNETQPEKAVQNIPSSIAALFDLEKAKRLNF